MIPPESFYVLNIKLLFCVTYGLGEHPHSNSGQNAKAARHNPAAINGGHSVRDFAQAGNAGRAVKGLEILDVAKSEAESPMPGWDSDQGYEYDLTLNWDIYDNLNFRGVFAYLDAGDYWKQDDPTRDVEDLTTFYGRLILSF